MVHTYGSCNVMRHMLHKCHNHPSGNAEPSPADRALTKRLQETMELVDVRVLDHFIVGDGDPLSMAEYGWI